MGGISIMQNVKKMKLLSVFAACMAAVMVLAAIPDVAVKAAARYRGSGTMADPYLVQTAEQLQSMRENLSAHYKLANTIDLSGMDFKPIGRLDGPFSGSFVCELNADLTPKYIIKNLSVHTTESAYSAENKNKWEAGLFGATNGATISGIYILDAKITNDNQGGNSGSVAWGNYVPGQDEKNAGILIGEADATTVSNCGSTGVVDGRANNCGGLIGRSNDSTIMNCYSTATVKSGGYWNIGGLIGGAGNTTISTSYSTGDVSGAQSNIGSFIGSAKSCTVVDCYAAGNAAGGRERKNSFVVVPDGASGSFKNCFALGTIDAAVEIVNNPITTSNCWVLSGKLHNTEQFKEGSLEQIKSAFAGIANWNTSGNQPALTTMGVVTDASKYVPGTGDSQTNAGGTANNQTAENSTEVIDQTGAAVQTVTPEEVKALIEALPDPDIEGAITIKNKEEVKKAWKAYESLSAGDKDDFDAALAGKLASARYQMSVLVAGELVEALEELPEVEQLTSKDVKRILELWDDYTFLDDSVKKELDEKWIEKLEAAYEFAQKNDQGQIVENMTGLTKSEKIIVIVCSVFITIAIIFDIVIFVMILKRMNKLKAKQPTENVVDDGGRVHEEET